MSKKIMKTGLASLITVGFTVGNLSQINGLDIQEESQQEPVETNETNNEANGLENIDNNTSKTSNNRNIIGQTQFVDEEGNIKVIDVTDGTVIQSRAQTSVNNVVNFNYIGAGTTTTYVDYYSGKTGYISKASAADAAYLGMENGKVKFMMAGVIGLVDQSKVQVVNAGNYYVSNYEVNSKGELFHYISNNLNAVGNSNGQSANYNAVGKAPSYIKKGIQYYSYDGHYFYNDYNKMISDYKAGTRNNSVNPDSPYYNYFQYLPYRSTTNYTASDINNYLNTKKINYNGSTVALANTPSKLKNIGETLIFKQNQYGTNALMILSLAIHESSWGTSRIALDKNNLFGINATDSNPYENASTYESVDACVEYYASNLVSKGYCNPNSSNYNGSYFGDKGSGMNVKYASDPYWGEKAAATMMTLDNSSGEKDANKYTIGIKNTINSSPSTSSVYTDANTNNKIFDIKGMSNVAFIVKEARGDYYKVQSDAVLNSTRTNIDSSSANYDFSSMYGYVNKENIKMFGEISQPANEAPKISNVKISNVTKNGYTVTATVTDDTKLDKVLFGTWTTKNGQDDMVWQPGTISGNTVTYTVKTSDHNKESGEYRTVLYAYDNEGLLTTTGAYVTNIPAQNKAPQISNVVVKDITSTSYKIECKVTDDLKVDRVLFGTWTTKNGQDDMIWQPGTIDGDTVTYTVSRDNHNFEYGTYNTHIYAYDEEDGLSIHANNGIKIEKPSNYSIPLIYDVYISDLNEDGYTITCQVESNKNISQVLFGTWTMYGGQDDMVWQPGKIEGNTVTYRVNRSQHNFEYGAYKTAIYAYDGEGNLASVITPIQNVKNSSAKSGWLEDANHKYFYDGYGQLVGNGPSKKVIDVSKWNYDIDWQTVKDSGDVDGVIIRIKNGQKLEEDPYFWKNYSECKRLGIPVGLYIYSYAGNGNQALEEANYVINTLNKRGITPNDLAYPVFLDLEGEYATATAQQYVDIVEQFVDRINSYGFDAKVYSYRSYLNSVLNNPKIWKHVSWVAAYTDSLGFNNPYYNGVKGWQYTSSGYVPGISTSVDINCWYEE